MIRRVISIDKYGYLIMITTYTLEVAFGSTGRVKGGSGGIA